MTKLQKLWRELQKEYKKGGLEIKEITLDIIKPKKKKKV